MKNKLVLNQDEIEALRIAQGKNYYPSHPDNEVFTRLESLGLVVYVGMFALSSDKSYALTARGRKILHIINALADAAVSPVPTINIDPKALKVTADNLRKAMAESMWDEKFRATLIKYPKTKWE